MFHQLPHNTPSSIIVAIGDVTEKDTKTGKKYHAVTLIARDQSRQAVNFWEGGPPPPQIGTVVKFRATWSKSDFGLEAKNVSMIVPTEEETKEFSKCFIRPETLRAAEVIQTYITNDITDDTCRDLCEWLWQTHGTEYTRAAAARANHQPYSGGLIEHTAAMLLLAEGIINAFNPNTTPIEHHPLHTFYKLTVNPSIIYTSIIFHDCGKIWENNFTPAPIPCHMPFNRIAEYHGHIAIGHTLIIEAYNELMFRQNTGPIPFAQLPEIIHHLCHCILSHHGQLDWGSPIEPKTIEAHIVHTVDNLEAKTWMHCNNIHTGEPLPDNLHKSRGPIRMTISPMERGL